MTVGQFEIHLTVDTKDANAATAVAIELHWKTSEIARDPVLGNKNFFYLTTYATSFQVAMQKLSAAQRALDQRGVRLIREKVEQIVHDIRYPE